MSARTREDDARPKITIRMDSNDKTYFDKFMETSSLNITGAFHAILDSHRLSGLQFSPALVPDGCRNCPKFAGVTEKGVLCITKKTPTDPVRYDLKPFPFVKVCWTKPFNTPVDKKTREQYEKNLEEHQKNYAKLTGENTKLFNERQKYHDKYELVKWAPEANVALKKELEQVKQPLQDLLKEKEEWKIQFNEEHNTLLKVLEEKTTLQTDNEFLRAQNMHLSESELLKDNKRMLDENDSLWKELGSQKEELSQEIEKLQAWLKEERNQKSDIIFHLTNKLREIDQCLPTFGNQLAGADLQIKAYVDSLRKTIQDLKGYLQTVAS